MTFVYLDNNASTPLDSDVIEAMEKWKSTYGNPHAGHFLGGLAREAISKSRSQVLNVFGLDESRWTCVFTSGASESNNLAIKGAVFNAIRKRNNKPIKLFTSAVEHSSVDNCTTYLRELFGSETVHTQILPVDSHGLVSLETAESVLEKNGSFDLLSCIHTVAETGAVQPISDIAKLFRSYSPNGLVHCDASQSVGKLSQACLTSVGVHADLITVAGHKFGAPKGIGALLVRNEVMGRIDPIIHGAGQEFNMRGGTENVASIVGLGTACELASKSIIPETEPAEILWETIRCILDSFQVDYRLNSTSPVRSPFTVNFSVAGMNGPQIVSHLGNDNKFGAKICFSAGSACHSRGGPSPSKVLAAMGLEPKYSTSGIRLSIGKSISAEKLVFAGEIIARHICESL